MQGRDVTVVLIAVGVVALLFLLFAGGAMMGPGMMGWWGPGFSPWWGIGMVLFWALAIGGLVWLVVWLMRQAPAQAPGAGPRAPGALDILRERYARGEIDREQFEQMKRDIERP